MNHSPASASYYPPPVDQLLRLGQPKNDLFVLDYATLGIGSTHVPELLRMVADDGLHCGPENSPLVWAPVHAWRALAQLKDPSAVGPLLGLLLRIREYDDDWITTEVPKVLGQFGRAALEPVTAYVADPDKDEWTRVSAAEALGKIGERHAELRMDCVARLSTQLEKFAEQSQTLNAFLVSPLLDLKAVEALPVIGRAFAAGLVDEFVAGDYEDVEIALGLRTERQHPRKPNQHTELGERLAGLAGDEELMGDDELVDEIMGGGDGSIATATVRNPPKIGRNDPCPCGSGKKFKKCCGGA